MFCYPVSSVRCSIISDLAAQNRCMLSQNTRKCQGHAKWLSFGGPMKALREAEGNRHQLASCCNDFTFRSLTQCLVGKINFC